MSYWQAGQLAPNSSGRSGCEPVLTRGEATRLEASHQLEWVRGQQRIYQDPKSGPWGVIHESEDGARIWRRGFATALEQILKTEGAR